MSLLDDIQALTLRDRIELLWQEIETERLRRLQPPPCVQVGTPKGVGIIPMSALLYLERELRFALDLQA